MQQQKFMDNKAVALNAFSLLLLPLSLANGGASSRDHAAAVLVLFSIILQKGVLVPMQVVH